MNIYFLYSPQMYRILQRAYGTSHHNRDILAVFTGNKVRYTIPIYFEPERSVLGNTLEIELDLSSLATERLEVKKIGLSPLYKTIIVPEVKLLT